VLLAAGFYPSSSTPEALDALSRSEFEKWTQVAKRARIRIE